jgi:hypothetical protein
VQTGLRVDYAECLIWAMDGMLRGGRPPAAGAGPSKGAAAAVTATWEPALKAGFALRCQSVKEE